MVEFPNSKINIGLSITSKREDGFHNLETIFYPINLCDALEIKINNDKQNNFSSSGIEIDGSEENNLCLKAYNLLKKDFDLPFFNIHLHKQVPIGGGLGGGSADASYMLKMIDKTCNLNLSIEQLEKYSLQLGSDCPIFIQNKPMFAKGRGEILTEIELDLSDYTIVIVNPRIHVSTKTAFSNLTPKAADFDLQAISKYKVKEWKNFVVNDFEKNIFKVYPELQTIKDKLYELGAEYASMSGSGSTMYGIFKEFDSKIIKKEFKEQFVFINE
jgi:4-diphosphocytidyl-2-C-methyl-D-erythritol kinase